LPVAKEGGGRVQDDSKKEPEPKKERDPSAKLVALMRKRDIVKRSAKEEEMVYGRTFVGCGRQKDYEATTKLGEGTFG
jgi:serine/threonine-protein kinase BUR1